MLSAAKRSSEIRTNKLRRDFLSVPQQVQGNGRLCMGRRVAEVAHVGH